MVGVCARRRTVFYELAERFASELLAGAMEDYWSPILLGAAKNELRKEIAGLFRADDVDEDPEHPVACVVSTTTHAQCHGMFRAFYLATGKPLP